MPIRGYKACIICAVISGLVGRKCPYWKLLIASCTLLLTVACGGEVGTPTPVIMTSEQPTATFKTVLPSPTNEPSPTSVPLAAVVNGDGITLAEYQAELSRYQAVYGTELATESERRVLDELIDQVLLAQAASQAGYLVDEEHLTERTDQLAARIGGTQALLEWMQANQYSEEEFYQSLKRSIAATWMRDQIAAQVPDAVEQVHARQILLYNSNEADQVLERLNSGQDFGELAETYDPIAKGDLGWFPRGYLLDPVLDEAVFNLEPGNYSQIVQTDAGFHILQLIERELQHPLAPDVRLVLQHQALDDWLVARREQSDIQVLLPQ